VKRATGEIETSSEGEKEAHLFKRRHFVSICLSSVEMVAGRQREAAYHNKQWRQAS